MKRVLLTVVLLFTTLSMLPLTGSAARTDVGLAVDPGEQIAIGTRAPVVAVSFVISDNVSVMAEIYVWGAVGGPELLHRDYIPWGGRNVSIPVCEETMLQLTNYGSRAVWCGVALYTLDTTVAATTTVTLIETVTVPITVTVTVVNNVTVTEWRTVYRTDMFWVNMGSLMVIVAVTCVLITEVKVWRLKR